MPLPPAPDEGASALPAGTYDGKVVIVTGGGTGLGKAIAIEFARVGATIAVVSRDPEHHRAGIAAIEGVGAKAIAVGCDIREPDQVSAAFDEIERQIGLGDVLVNNAAGNFPAPAGTGTSHAADWATSRRTGRTRATTTRSCSSCSL
jgi:NAD(P)-dependent dehydrogenase (short-subunit alcohol dehydrogenase family)